MKIIYLNLNNLKEDDFNNLLLKLSSLNIQETYLNDFSFCPNFIIHYNEDNQIIYENINDGYLNYLKEHYMVIEVFSIDEVIEEILTLDNNQNKGLF